MASSKLTIPPLVSGGVMLTYRCTNSCRHCLYRCSTTHPEEYASETKIDAIFEALSKERSLHGIHIAGGEATLCWDKLEYALRSATRHGIHVDYLETNGHWCTDIDTARNGFEALRNSGLSAVLISASLFHNEFIPLAHTKNAIRAANEILGGNVIVWTPEVLRLMSENLEEDRTHTLRESCEKIGISMESGELWSLHSYLTPGGRAAETLGKGLQRKPAESFRGDTCERYLQSTTHFHIDPQGNLFTGHCPGIAPADISDLHPQINSKDHPVYTKLFSDGPFGLMQKADGFTPRKDGYIGKCELCLDIRKHMFKTGDYPELSGHGFYTH